METVSAPKKRARKLTGIFPGLWCWLLSPDTKFSEDGVYSVDLAMSVDEAKALIGTVMDEVKAEADSIRRQENGKYAQWKIAWPVKDYDGDDEQYKGKKLITFKQKVNPKFDFHVDVFDAKKNLIAPGSLRIGNGTKMRISFNVRTVADNLNKCIRVMFHPVAAQIIELCSWEADYGFESVDNGFEAASTTRMASTAAGQPVDDFDGAFGSGNGNSGVGANFHHGLRRPENQPVTNPISDEPVFDDPNDPLPF